MSLEENSEVWEKRTREETARIREEEKLERLEIVKEKKKKFQKGYLSKEETKKLKERTETFLELAELKQNLWRCYRDGEKLVLAPGKRKNEKKEEKDELIQPGGKKSKDGPVNY